MSEFDRLEKPFLTDQDEEYKMLMETADLYTMQKAKTAEQKSGNATEIIIRKYLLKEKFNVTLNPNVKIDGSKIKIDSLLLKPTVSPNELVYEPDKVDTIIEIKNNSVTCQSATIKENFDKLRKISDNFRFAVIVLSERKGYKHEITDKKLKNKKYHSFTLVSRRKYPKHGLYLKSNIIDMLSKNEMKKTGDWEKLIAYLKGA
jgi:hypothetical protein